MFFKKELTLVENFIKIFKFIFGFIEDKKFLSYNMVEIVCQKI